MIVVEANPNDGGMSVSMDHPLTLEKVGSVFLTATPCWIGQTSRGGIGGSAVTACPECGTMCPNTASGRHEGFRLTPVVVDGFDVKAGCTIVLWRRFIKGLDY